MTALQKSGDPHKDSHTVQVWPNCYEDRRAVSDVIGRDLSSRCCRGLQKAPRCRSCLVLTGFVNEVAMSSYLGSLNTASFLQHEPLFSFLFINLSCTRIYQICQILLKNGCRRYYTPPRTYGCFTRNLRLTWPSQKPSILWSTEGLPEQRYTT